jgi:hypothetical protein
MSEALFNELKEDINERQLELSNVQKVLDYKAKQYSSYAKWYKIAVIFLGALVTTRQVADTLYPGSSKAILFLYTAFGLAITVIGGITAAFGYDRKSAELKVLAAKCNSCALDIDGRLPKQGETLPLDQQISSARDLIALQNTCISELQGKAAELGLDITRKVRKLASSGAP